MQTSSSTGGKYETLAESILNHHVHLTSKYKYVISLCGISILGCGPNNQTLSTDMRALSTMNPDVHCIIWPCKVEKAGCSKANVRSLMDWHYSQNIYGFLPVESNMLSPNGIQHKQLGRGGPNYGWIWNTRSQAMTHCICVVHFTLFPQRVCQKFSLSRRKAVSLDSNGKLCRGQR